MKVKDAPFWLVFAGGVGIYQKLRFGKFGPKLCDFGVVLLGLGLDLALFLVTPVYGGSVPGN